MPCADGGVVPRASAARVAPARLVPGGLPGPPAPSLLLPLSVPRDVGARRAHWTPRRVQARDRAAGLPAAAPGLCRVPPRALRVSRAAPGRRGRARLPLRRGNADLGRLDRQHARRGVLLHVRRRIRGPVPGGPGAGARGRPGAVAARGGARVDRLRPRLCGALGRPDGGRPAHLRSRAAPGQREGSSAAPGLALGGGGARLLPGGAVARPAPGGLGLDDALRRCLDRRDDARHPPAALAAAHGRGCRRDRGDARRAPVRRAQRSRACSCSASGRSRAPRWPPPARAWA